MEKHMLYESYGALPLAQTFDGLQEITRTTLASLGAIYITPAAQALLKQAALSPVALAVVHAHGLWCGVDAYETRLNDIALACGGPMRSIYPIEGKAGVWLITEPTDAQGLRSGSLFLADWEYAQDISGEE
jgi:hypothetical protein